MAQDITLKPGESVTIRASGKSVGGGGEPSGGSSGGSAESVPGAPGTIEYAVPWAWQTEYLKTNGMHDNITLIIGFMIPADAPAGQKGRASGAEDAASGSGPNQRDACISTVKGSFTDGVIDSTSNNPSPIFWLEVGGNVQPGVTYYMNIKNSSTTGSNPTEMSCQVTITN